MVLSKEEATSDMATDHVTHGGVPLAGCRGLTTGECAVKRLSPQLVVTLRPLVMENTSSRHPGQPGTGVISPDLASRCDGPQPAKICTQSHAGRNAIASSLSPTPSRKAPGKPTGIQSILATPLARGGEDRCRAEVSCTQFVLPAIEPVICPRRGPAPHLVRPTPPGCQSTHLRPYFSSSLTLSIRGAVSPARHVLTRPRPHPVFRHEWEGIAGPGFVSECDDVRCPVRQSLS
jgi:hypothetical protein